MDLLKEVYDLKETVGHKIAQANKKIKAYGGDIADDDVRIVKELSESIGNLVTACVMLEAEEEGGYSERYAPMWNHGITYGYAGREGRAGGGGGYSREGYSREGYSREGRNRYSREGRAGYSREGRAGYSRAEDMTEQLRQMMDEAPDEITRMEIKKLVDQMENRR